MAVNCDNFSPDNSELVVQNVMSNEDDKKVETKKLKWYEFETRLIPDAVIFMGVTHIGFAYYVFAFPYRDHPVLLAWALFMTYVNIFGVTGGVHRCWSHRSFKATLPGRIILALCFYSSAQMSLREWSTLHRIHHKYVDTEKDPHNIHRGFLFSHLGWIVLEEKPAVTECRKKIYMDDILEDPVVKFFDGNKLIMHILCVAVIPSLIPWYFFNQSLKWAIISQLFMRLPVSIQCLSFVNSLAHYWGYRTYDKHMMARENLFVSLAAMGEGWHNYHHTFPWDYRASEFSNFCFNPTTTVLNIFAKLGLIYDLKSVPEEHVQKVMDKKGDGSLEFQKYKFIDQILL